MCINFDWEQRKFNTLVSRISTSSVNEKLPRIEYEDIVSGQGILNKDILSKKSIKKGIEFLPNDILFGKLRPYLKNWLFATFNGIAVGDWWVLRPIDVNDIFIYTLIQSNKYQTVANLSTGTKMPRSDWKVVSQTNFLVPSNKDEQQKIGSFFKHLDDTITLHQRKYDLLKRMKLAMLENLFPARQSEAPQIRFNDFNKVWEHRTFGEIIKEFSIKSKIEDEYTVLSSTNSGMEIRDGRVSGNSNLGYKIIEDGDLVLSPQNLWLGNININDIGTGLVSPSYKTFKFMNVDSSFLKPQLRTAKMLESYKNSSTQGASVVRRNLEIDSFYQISMRVPTTLEQSRIGNLFKALDDIIAFHKKKIIHLKKLKKYFLTKMFV